MAEEARKPDQGQEKDPVKELEEIVKRMQEIKSQQELEDFMGGLTDEQAEAIIEQGVDQQTTSEPNSEAEPESEKSEPEDQHDKSKPEPTITASTEETEEVEEEEVENPLDRIQKDPVLRQLSAMTEEERVAWAVQNGTAGIVKLMELQRLELQQMIEESRRESSVPVLEKMLYEWTERNKDLLSDDLVQKVAMGLDQVLMQEVGKSSWKDFSPSEFQEHLSRLESLLKQIVSNRLTQTEEPKGSQKRPAPSVGDLTGGVPPETSALDILEKVSADPFKLEQLISKMKPEDLDRLLAQLE